MCSSDLDILAQHPRPNNVIVGVRPEHLEDSALIDTYERIRALTFQVTVDFVESLGADKYVHFKTEGAGAQAAQLAELAADSDVGENDFVARVSTESKVTAGQTIELAFDTSKITIFDADTGANVTIEPPSATPPPAPAPPPPPPALEPPAEAPEPVTPPAETAEPPVSPPTPEPPEPTSDQPPPPPTPSTE